MGWETQPKSVGVYKAPLYGFIRIPYLSGGIFPIPKDQGVDSTLTHVDIEHQIFPRGLEGIGAFWQGATLSPGPVTDLKNWAKTTCDIFLRLACI